MAAPFQIVEFAPGEDLNLVFTMTVNGSIATYTLTFTARLPDGTVAFTCTVGSGITITTSGGISAPGVFTVAPTAAQTALFPSPCTGKWDVWRTNSGTAAQLARGDLDVDEQYRV